MAAVAIKFLRYNSEVCLNQFRRETTTSKGHKQEISERDQISYH